LTVPSGAPPKTGSGETFAMVFAAIMMMGCGIVLVRWARI
jgi:LPXTG-motif cell wall-anchored protein